MAYRLTESSTNCSCDNDSIRVKSHCLALGSVIEISFCAKSSSTRAQVHLEAVQLTNECLQESGEPYIPRDDVSDICICARTSAVGKECFESRHKNILSLASTCVFQSVFHDPASVARLDEPEVHSNQASLRSLVATNMLYADLTENVPCFSQCQLQKSWMLRVQRGIPRIMRSSIGMKISSMRA